jgi:hypothetical protein
MQKLILLLILLVKVECSHSQTTFLVTDGEGIPISNIQVILNKMNIGRTDKEGMIKMATIKKNDSVVFKSDKDYETYYYVAIKNNPKEIQEIELQLNPIVDRIELGFNDVLPIPEEVNQVEEKIYDVPEVAASFPGGAEKMNLYLSKMIQKPEIEHQGRTKLTTYVKMVVEKNGMLSNIQIVKGAFNCNECDKEALRVVKSMPKFTPGINNGRAVRSYFIFPVKFEYD